MTKRKQMEALVEARRVRFKHYKRLADYPGFECEFVSPYSKGAHDMDSGVMILLQDWSSHDALWRSAGPSELGRDPDLPTNKNLEFLLHKFLRKKLSETYATNLFPYIKLGGLSSRIPFADLQYAAENFALRQIQIIAPRLVICLGKNTFNALRVAAGYPRCRDMASAIGPDAAFKVDVGGGRSAVVWAQAHPGVMGQNNRNRQHPGRTLEDWQRMCGELGLVAPH